MTEFMKHSFKKVILIILFIMLGLADLLIINTLFFNKINLTIEPIFFREHNLIESSESGLLSNLLKNLYNGFIKYITIYPRVILLLAVFIISFCIICEVLYFIYNVEKGKYFIFIKTFTNSLGISVILFHYNLFIVKSTKISNDVVANMGLFKVILKKDISEKKQLFMQTLNQTIDSSTKLIDIYKNELKIFCSKFYNDVLFEEYLDKTSTESLYNAAKEDADFFISKKIIEIAEFDKVEDKYDFLKISADLICNGNNNEFILGVICGAAVLGYIIYKVVVNNYFGV